MAENKVCFEQSKLLYFLQLSSIQKQNREKQHKNKENLECSKKRETLERSKKEGNFRM
jgi:hypothetical protein